MALDLAPETLALVAQVLSTTGLTVMGVRGMIAALTARVDSLEVALSDLRARYAANHPVGGTPLP